MLTVNQDASAAHADESSSDPSHAEPTPDPAVEHAQAALPDTSVKSVKAERAAAGTVPATSTIEPSEAVAEKKKPPERPAPPTAKPSRPPPPKSTPV